MENTPIRTRFAPSPTGELHLGNVRTALFNWLLAKRHGGMFILRIEDTDKARSDSKLVAGILEDLHWSGLTWQEGPDCGGDYGPYVQSERQVIYDEFYQRLELDGLAYPCFCTDEQLAISRKTQLSAGLPPRYAGMCSALNHKEIQKKLKEGLGPTLRFRVPRDETIQFTDGIKGKQEFTSNVIGDFIIRRADGTPSFIFCNAIDDALMHMTHVIRGDDHLANTPRQLLILKALGLSIPHYAHIPLIVGVGGAPLSKRMGGFSVKALWERGYFPEAVVNQLARLGHSYESHDLLSKDELAIAFSLARISASAAHFDEGQLLHWQKTAVLKRDTQALWNALVPALNGSIPEEKQNAFVEWIRPNLVFPKDAVPWAQCLVADEIAFSDESITLLKAAPREVLVLVAQKLREERLDFKEILETVGETLKLKGKMLYQPVRVALTGKLQGPELKQLVALLGRERAALRIEKALGALSC